MDPTVLNYALAALAGWAGGALVASDPEPKPPPKEDPPPPPYPPRPCPKCPHPVGALFGVILWAIFGPSLSSGDTLIPVVLTGLVGGLFGGSLSGYVALFRTR
jgi:hypothetical protein